MMHFETRKELEEHQKKLKEKSNKTGDNKMEKSCETCHNPDKYNCLPEPRPCDQWKPKPKEKLMVTNEQIVQAAKECVENYKKWLMGGFEIGGSSNCALCVLFKSNCDNCVFPEKCGVGGGSYSLFMSHWKENHRRYCGGLNKATCVSGCCVPYGKAVIKDLNDIIEKYSEVEKFYSIGDRFKIGFEEYILAKVKNACFCGLINIKTGCRWSKSFQVESVLKITEGEFFKICDGDSFTHISGPTYSEKNLCKHGYVFGEDFNICGIGTGSPCGVLCK